MPPLPLFTSGFLLVVGTLIPYRTTRVGLSLNRGRRGGRRGRSSPGPRSCRSPPPVPGIGSSTAAWLTGGIGRRTLSDRDSSILYRTTRVGLSLDRGRRGWRWGRSGPGPRSCSSTLPLPVSLSLGRVGRRRRSNPGPRSCSSTPQIPGSLSLGRVRRSSRPGPRSCRSTPPVPGIGSSTAAWFIRAAGRRAFSG
jgi:hypothetical protein